MRIRSTVAPAAALAAVMAFGLTASGAQAADQPEASRAPAAIGYQEVTGFHIKNKDVTGHTDIKDGSINRYQIADGTLLRDDLHPAWANLFDNRAANHVTSAQVANGSLTESDLNAAAKAKLNDKTGRVTDVESDGPYPGATDLGDLEGQGDNSDELVPGDSGAASHVVWVKCAPGKVALGGGFTLGADASLAAKKAIQVVASHATGAAIAGDPAMSLRPDGWTVEVINNGASAVVVRPWVNCAKVG